MDEKFALMERTFNWNKEKNLSNIRKHGISFKEAATVFLDTNATLILDDEHSDGEDRYIVIGMSKKLKMLMVCHCYRDEDGGEVIRLISARQATNQEQKLYGDGGA
ncbi:MAG: BrnT family toxin [Defluviitaleaceae bacterium]|nr:BrnT family toxin [Defluviitaleaceae bacterium]MCL2261983.1 BrnT family toxin [Defluviitaleaceae bacterium]